MSCYEVEDGSWRICKLSLRTGTIIIGWLDVLYAVIRGIVASVRLSEYGGKNGISFFDCTVLIVISLLAVLEFITSFTLLWGVRNRLFSKIQIWVPAQKVLLALYLLMYIVMFISNTQHWLIMIYLIIFHPIIIYFIPVVSCYAASQKEIF